MKSIEKTHAILGDDDQAIIKQIIADAVDIALNEERNTIGQELHDHVNQQLALAIMYIAAAEKKPLDYPDLLSQSVQLITQSINEIRKISHHLITEKNREFSLVKSLNELIKDLTSVHPLHISFNHSNFNEALVNYEIQLHIFRILQELLSNVLKHAHATQVNIQLSLVQQQINLLFEDNGIGFDFSSKINGIGLMNINDRVKNINGSINIARSPIKGTKITINSTLL